MSLPDEAPSGEANGLDVEFFEGIEFGRKLKTRVETRVDWLWGFDGPDLDVPKDSFSARWTGWLKAPQPGRYKLIVVCDDGARLWLDRELVIDAWRGGLPSRYTAEVDLTGKAQTLKLEYFQGGGPAIISLRWQKYGGFREQPIPATAFFRERDAMSGGASLPITTPSETTPSRTIKSPAEAPPSKPPAPPAGPLDTAAPAAYGKAQAARSRGGATAKTDPTVPFRVATNKLAGRQFIDPITFGPDEWGFNERGAAEPWTTRDAFARLTTRAARSATRNCRFPDTCSKLNSPSTGAATCIRSGDPYNRCEIDFWWNPQKEAIECKLRNHRGYDGAWTGGHKDIAPEGRINLKLAVGDGIQTLFHENKPILSADSWPTDCGLVIWSVTRIPRRSTAARSGL